MNSNRIDLLRKLIKSVQVDGVLVQDPANVRYISGFSGEGCLLVAGRSKTLLTDSRYEVQAKGQTRGFHILVFRTLIPELAALIKKIGIGKLGFEAEFVSYSFYRELKAKLRSVKMLPVDRELAVQRLYKTPEEIKVIRDAIGIAGEAFQVALADLGKGRREYEFAAQLEYECRRRGAEKMAFNTIVASGPRGALPHGVASAKKIRSGELVTIDWGIVLNGYHSDETQTIACGKTTAKQRDIYYTVKEAHDLAIEKIKPGVTFREVDAVARNYIREKGFGKYFGHGLGHGVGLKVHEAPQISWQSDGTVEEEMVFTVEPGIYIPDWGGVRIESMIRVRKGFPDVLTVLHKGLRVIG